MTIVKLSNGALSGSTLDGIHAFKGIPYAEPMAGLARWLPPQRRRPWEGVRDACHYAPACMQFAGSGSKIRLPFPTARNRYFDAIGGTVGVQEGDDSLVVNVWSPSLDRSANLPVMVWVHGGGFASGAANAFYDGTPFARHNVVVVAIQYRLGPPGFLHGSGLFEGEVCADNRGLLDLIEALRWVQENIAVFGGDSGRVTLFGESAGAFALYQLAASPLAKGLFHRCIAMGGMAGTCAPADDYHVLTRDVLQDVGVAAGDAQALAALDKPRLAKLQSAVSSRVFRGKDPERYGILGREKVGFMGAATHTAFLPQAPLATYPAGTPNNIDLMLGTCGSDGQLFSLAFPVWQGLSARLFGNMLKGLVPNGDRRAMVDFYRQQIPGVSSARIEEHVNNDAFYRMPTIAAAEAHAAGHRGKTFLYELEYQSVIPGIHAVHGIDVALLFRSDPVKRLLFDDEATTRLSEQMVQAWCRFAATGQPHADGLPHWPAYDEIKRSTMILDRTSRLTCDPDTHLRQFWFANSKTPPSATPGNLRTLASN